MGQYKIIGDVNVSPRVRLKNLNVIKCPNSASGTISIKDYFADTMTSFQHSISNKMFTLHTTGKLILS